MSSGIYPDLIVCRGRYFDQKRGHLTRRTSFRPKGFLDSTSFRRALFSGFTPPHQATFFGPGSRRYLDHYSDYFRLSADLDYFLQLSANPGLCIQCLNIELVYMSSGGVSALQTHRRLKEVSFAYRRIFGLFWVLPFLMRYVHRIFSKFLSWN